MNNQSTTEIDVFAEGTDVTIGLSWTCPACAEEITLIWTTQIIPIRCLKCGAGLVNTSLKRANEIMMNMSKDPSLSEIEWGFYPEYEI